MNYQAVQKYTPLLKGMAFCCFGISAYFTVRLLSGFGTDKGEALAFGLFGLVAQGSQSLLPAIAPFKEGYVKPICYVVFSALITLSLAGTFGNFIVSHSKKVHHEEREDETLKQMRRDLKMLDQQLEAHDRNIREFSRRSIITKGVRPESARKEKTMQARLELSEKMRNYTPAASVSNSVYSGIAKVLSYIFGANISTESAMLGLFCAYAIVLDVLGALLMYLVISNEVQRETGVKSEKDNIPKIKTKTPKQPTQPEPSGAMAKTETPNAIGFTASQPQAKVGATITPELITSYLRTAFKGEDKPEYLLGQYKIARAVGLTDKQGKEVRRILKRKGIIEVKGLRSIPQHTLDDALQLVAV